MVRTSTLAAFTLWHFPLEEDLPGRLRKTQKNILLPACCCMAVSWHGGGRAAVLLQGALSSSQLPAPFQSSSNIINPPAFLDITKTTIAMHSYGCCRILFPRSYFHFCRNICILCQNFPRLLYAWGKIFFCLFEGLIKCCTARGSEQGDKRKRMWLFYSKNSCDFIWAFFIVSATKRSTAKMFDRMVAFTEDIMRFWKSYLVTQGIVCTRSPLSAPAYLIIQLP